MTPEQYHIDAQKALATVRDRMIASAEAKDPMSETITNESAIAIQHLIMFLSLLPLALRESLMQRITDHVLRGCRAASGSMGFAASEAGGQENET